ncbi:glycyl-radical enzyme activating protein [Candidatus Bathyarchaeota archaeon]|nr:glycyl-radical enzyme activating protein [Candidatus Bathyarchaeota archaeon]
MTTGLVFDIKHFAVHDGPGIRTTVFVKGCPLRCMWCHNPESLTSEPQLMFTPSRCIGCGYCMKICDHGAHITVNGAHEVDWTKCEACGKCAAECYSGALEIAGREVSVDEVMEAVLKDKVFFENSKGGMTISGGEPLSQPEFTVEVFRRAKENGIHTSLDTSGYAAWSVIEKVIEHVDLVLYDIKQMDSERHKEYTGVSNELIIENLKKIDTKDIPIWVRIPTIPGLNDDEDNFRKIGELLSLLKHLERVDILRYHKLAESKYEHTGQDYRLKGMNTPEKDEVEHLKDILEGYGLSNVIIS